MEVKHSHPGDGRDRSLRLSQNEIEQLFCDEATAKKFPPILTIEQVAELIQYPVGTVRDWRSRGLLQGCCRKIGRELRFLRNRLIEHLFNHNPQGK